MDVNQELPFIDEFLNIDEELDELFNLFEIDVNVVNAIINEIFPFSFLFSRNFDK